MSDVVKKGVLDVKKRNLFVSVSLYAFRRCITRGMT